MIQLIIRTVILLIVLTFILIVAGCKANQSSNSPYTATSQESRDPVTSQRLTQQATELLISNPGRAESLLRDALRADLYNGQAHNNLGALYLAQGKLYEAAGEFEWARKLLPGHPDPRLNLALTLEHAGRTDEAIATYATALEVYPEHIPTMQALTRLLLRTGKADDRTPHMLSEIALRGESQDWRTWAQQQQLQLIR